MCSAKTVGPSLRPVSLFDYPPAWNRALCRFIDAERRRFRGRSIRMELDLNGRLQAAVTTGLPLRVCTAPAATRGSSLLRWA